MTEWNTPGATRAPSAAASTPRGDDTSVRSARLKRHFPANGKPLVDAGPSVLERLASRRGREFGAVNREPEAVAGHRIDEAGGVAGEQ